MARKPQKTKVEVSKQVKDQKEQKSYSIYKHRQDAEWLTIEICQEYRRRALAIDKNECRDIGERRKLRIELQEKCDILEIEALNIINGLYHEECVRKYKKVKMALNGSCLLDANSCYELYLREMADDKKREGLDEFSIPDEIDT